MKPTLIVVAGATATGKTALAAQLARHFNTSIISADSRQCYRELGIGVAKPPAPLLNEIRHYFINTHSIHNPVDVAGFEQYALQALKEIFTHNPVAIAAGGTGLYIKALCEGLDAMPAIPTEIRENVRQQYQEKGITWLQETIKQHDSIYFAEGENQNPHRLMRALEFVLATGQSIKTFQKGSRAKRDFDIIKIGIEIPRDILIGRINQRVDEMISEGLVEEAKALLPYQHLQALQTVGYAELFACLNGLSSLSAAIEFIKTNTRQYAKRQMTWFKKDEEMKWFAPTDHQEILSHLEAFLKKAKS